MHSTDRKKTKNTCRYSGGIPGQHAKQIRIFLFFSGVVSRFSARGSLMVSHYLRTAIKGTVAVLEASPASDDVDMSVESATCPSAHRSDDKRNRGLSNG